MKRASVVLLLLLLACHSKGPSLVDSWKGRYVYEEEPLPPTGGVAPGMEWDLDVRDTATGPYALLDVNGLQTFVHARTTLELTPDHLLVRYDSLLDGSATWKRGDTLFTLSRKGRNLTTHWKTAEPILRDDMPRSCNCFQ